MSDAQLSPRVALVTGSSGFIGYHLCQRLLAEGWRVAGIDSLSDYYDVALKRRRQELLTLHPRFSVVNNAIETPGALHGLFKQVRPDVVIHLAAQAGVRHSIDNPRSYLASNIAGTFEVLEAARAYPPAHLLLASTSSVYGANEDLPYKEITAADHPLSFYAATKKAGEAMAHSYAHLYALPITNFRFFTVYGPWGRPDMALFKFTKAIFQGLPIDVYNHGQMRRDFTYIDDLIEAVRRLMDVIPSLPEQRAALAQVAGDSLSPAAPWRVVNLGNAKPVKLTHFISEIEKATGLVAKRNLLAMQAGDVPQTWADVHLVQALTGFAPKTDVATGVAAFVTWYRAYYKV